MVDKKIAGAMLGVMMIVSAAGCAQPTADEQELDDMEFLNVRTYTADEIKQLVFEEKFQQAIHIMAWLFALGT